MDNLNEIKKELAELNEKVDKFLATHEENEIDDVDSEDKIVEDADTVTEEVTETVEDIVEDLDEEVDDLISSQIDSK